MIIRILILAILFLSTNITWANDVARIRIHGSTTVGATLMPKIVEQWLLKKKYVDIKVTEINANEHLIQAKRQGNALEVEIQTYGSSTGFKALKEGRADLAMASRRIKPKELNVLGDLDTHDKEWVVGIDGIAVVLHPSNPVKQLDIKQIRQIYTGEITDWSQLGAPKGMIKLYTRDKKSGTLDAMKSMVMNKQTMASSAQELESNGAMAKAIGADPAAIGFVGLPFIGDLNALHITDGGSKGVYPTELSVATEDYPLSRRLYVYCPDPENHLLASFGEFISSTQGQEAVRQDGFVSQNIQAFDVPLDDAYSADYKKMIENKQRLSINFRFQPGAYKLDNKSMQDVARLVNFAKENKGKLVLLGFTDGAEEEQLWRQIALSEERSDYVAYIIGKSRVYPKRVRGLGSSRLVASNETEHGRFKNRRVEVWYGE